MPYDPFKVYLILENANAPKETLVPAFFLELKIKNEFCLAKQCWAILYVQFLNPFSIPSNHELQTPSALFADFP